MVPYDFFLRLFFQKKIYSQYIKDKGDKHAQYNLGYFYVYEKGHQNAIDAVEDLNHRIYNNSIPDM